MQEIDKTIKSPSEATITETTVIKEDLQSVELKVDSKGNVKPVVKCYGETAREAGDSAVKEFDRLRKLYSD